MADRCIVDSITACFPSFRQFSRPVVDQVIPLYRHSHTMVDASLRGLQNCATFPLRFGQISAQRCALTVKKVHLSVSRAMEVAMSGFGTASRWGTNSGSMRISSGAYVWLRGNWGEAGRNKCWEVLLLETIVMESENSVMEDHFPIQPNGFGVPC